MDRKKLRPGISEINSMLAQIRRCFLSIPLVIHLEIICTIVHICQDAVFPPGGEEIVFRPARLGQIVIQSIWVIGVGILLYWSAPAIQAYFERGEIIGAARHLERFHLSEHGTFAAIIAWCEFLAWWGLGGL